MVAVYRAKPADGDTKYPTPGMLYVTSTLMGALVWGDIVTETGGYYWVERLEIPDNTPVRFDFNSWFDGGGISSEQNDIPLSEAIRYPMPPHSQIWLEPETRYRTETIGLAFEGDFILEGLSPVEEIREYIKNIALFVRRAIALQQITGYSEGPNEWKLLNAYMEYIMYCSSSITSRVAANSAEKLLDIFEDTPIESQVSKLHGTTVDLIEDAEAYYRKYDSKLYRLQNVMWRAYHMQANGECGNCYENTIEEHEDAITVAIDKLDDDIDTLMEIKDSISMVRSYINTHF